MPGRRGAGSGLLREHMVVVQLGGAAAHEPARGFGQGRIEDEPPVGRILLPVAEILDESARVVLGAGHFGARTQAGEICIDASAQRRDFRGPKQLPEAHRAVALKALHRCGVYHAENASRISSSNAGPR